MSAVAQNGIYNYGAAPGNTATDRAVGRLSSGSASQSLNIYTQLTNTGNSTINHFTISFSVEKYRNGSNSASFRMQMYYSTDGTTWTNAGSALSASGTLMRITADIHLRPATQTGREQDARCVASAGQYVTLGVELFRQNGNNDIQRARTRFGRCQHHGKCRWRASIERHDNESRQHGADGAVVNNELSGRRYECQHRWLPHRIQQQRGTDDDTGAVGQRLELLCVLAQHGHEPHCRDGHEHGGHPRHGCREHRPRGLPSTKSCRHTDEFLRNHSDLRQKFPKQRRAPRPPYGTHHAHRAAPTPRARPSLAAARLSTSAATRPLTTQS